MKLSIKHKFFLVLLVFLFCGSASADPANHQLKIGVISGLSGAAAKWNRFQNLGITLAKEDLEKKGWKINLIVEDSATTSPKAIAAFDKLLDLDKVDSIIADDFGFVLAPLIPRINQRKKLFIAISLPHDSYCKQSAGFLFSISSQFSLTKDAFNHFFEVHPEVKKIALIAFDDPEWGNTYLKIWNEIAKERGITVVDTFLSADFVPDFKSPLTKMLSKNPEAIFIAHEPQSFLKVRKQLGYTGHVIAANNFLEVLADNNPDSPRLDGIYLVDPAISEDFKRKFKTRFNLDPILEAYAGYESLVATVKAFENNPKAPEQGMKSVNYFGIAGQIDFSRNTCVGNFAKWGLFQFQNGTEQLVR